MLHNETYLFAIFVNEDPTSFLKPTLIEDSYFFEVSEKKPNQESFRLHVHQRGGAGPDPAGRCSSNTAVATGMIYLYLITYIIYIT